MNAGDLERFEALLAQADRVVPMRDIWKGDTGPRVIGLRHDVDNNAGSFDTAIRMAEWEFERGYSSTYYLLHGSWYWADIETMLVGAEQLEDLGHEVGIHVNAIAESLKTGTAPETLLHRALHDLRSAGLTVVGAAAHGDRLCRFPDRSLRFVNDEIFIECPRPEAGERPRLVRANGRTTTIIPLPLAAFGLEYATERLPRDEYITDAGSEWSPPFDDVVRRFDDSLRLHMNVHPDWWGGAFALERSRS